MQPIANYIEGRWSTPDAEQVSQVVNPATAKVLGTIPLDGGAGAVEAVEAAERAFPAWRRTPAGERIQYLFRFKQLLEDNFDDIARTTTLENGKTLAESRGELRRGIENVEVACGIPILMQGYNLEDIAPGIEEIMIRQPLGVVAIITPFNFPAMIPLWFLPYALACGNTLVLKPSEKAPLTVEKIVALLDRLDLPPGVVNVANGGKGAVDALLDHPAVRAVSFVGSTPVAKYIYTRGAQQGKRVQCQGGAKNHVVVLPDADLDKTVEIVTDSAFGCAGQRCLAVSTAVTVGEARESFRDAVVDAASKLSVGFGLDDGVRMGPVITAQSQTRIEGLIEQGLAEGARAALDGRGTKIADYENGNFLRPTVLEGVSRDSTLAETEIFGPVLSLVHAESLDEAIAIIAANPFGNASSIFTSDGAAARKFRYEVPTGNVGVNIGVAAPMAYFPLQRVEGQFHGRHARPGARRG